MPSETTKHETALQPSHQKKTKGIFVHTFGCQMNAHDSMKIMTLMSKKGYAPVAQPEQADVILLNTCSVREKPEQKVLSAVGRYGQLKKDNPHLVIGVGGCFARQEGDKLIERAPVLDLVFGPDNIPELPEMIEKIQTENATCVKIDFDPAEDVRFLEIAPEVLESRVCAMVTIMKGCDKYCSFCIVPYVRGRERCRSPHEIVQEVERLCAAGVREITLLGQSVTSYAWEEEATRWDLARLLRTLDGVEGLARLRFTSPYPRDFTDDLIECFGELGTLCEYVHLPVQSGSDQILHRMNRRHTRAEYFGWVDALRARCPTMTLSTDIIVGFPGETEADFADTMDLIERIRFEQLYSFKYSPRPYTPATRKMQVSEEDKQQRLAILQDRQKEILWEQNQALLGTVQEVLVEGPSRKYPDQMCGRTRTNKTVNFLAKEATLIGQIVQVKIEEAYAHSLIGTLCA